MSTDETAPRHPGRPRKPTQDRRWPLDAHGVLVEKGNRVKSVVGMLHETMLFYGRVVETEESLLVVSKENPGDECPKTRSAAHLWELASEDEVAPVYPTTEPWTLAGALKRAEAERLERERRESLMCPVCGRAK